VRYIAVGSKGRDMLLRHNKQVVGEFAGLPAAPSFADVSALATWQWMSFSKGGG